MKILIVEDDRSIAELERDYLALNGYECTLVEDGKKGLDMALREDFDLIVLDVMLPNMTGFEFCAKFREQKDIPIIIVSAKKEDIDKVRGLGIGADDYVIKPFSPNELVARVKSHIKRYETLTNKANNKEALKDIISVRELMIKKSERRVFINKEEKVMPAKEYDLLLFLVEHPNKVFSKEHLFDSIWGIDAIGDISTVTVHIRRLREKIEDEDKGRIFIETVWGVGYRLKG